MNRYQSKSALYWAFHDSLELTKRSSLHIIKSIDQLLSAIIMPVMFLLLFRYVFGGAIHLGENVEIEYVNFLVAGILVQTLAFGASTTTYNLALDLKRGMVDRFRSLPIFSPALLIGHVTADLVRNVFSSVIMLAVSLLVGFNPAATFVQWMYVLGLLLLFTFAFSWLSAILGLLVKNLEAASWISFIIVMPLTFASSAFVPTDNMPAALKSFAQNQPLTQVIEAIRAWFIGAPVGDAAWISVIWCVCITAVCIPAATWLFRGYKS